ncbi:MAG TPA: DUF3473 domain-containing protein, partial [Steroidobacteraceae bacterium]|nr:DUF3473 domain-containing protein [Steroidobacteraceae bacterium]
PWELDPEQPRIACSLRSRVRHYRGLNLTAERLQRLLGLFRFGPVSEVIKLADCVSEVQFSGASAMPFPSLAIKPQGARPAV